MDVMFLKVIMHAFLQILTDGILYSGPGMEGICVAHGKAIWAHEVFDAMISHGIDDDDARELLKEPWIGHLKRNFTPEMKCEIRKSEWIEHAADNLKTLAMTIEG